MILGENNGEEDWTKPSTHARAEYPLADALRTRKRQKKRKPHFVREESWRYKRVAATWRRPKGIDSKMRLKKKGRPKSVGVGYRSPRLVRGFHPSGFQEQVVTNIRDLEAIKPETIVRIGRTVGLRKRIQIIEKAEELGLSIINTRGVGTGES